MPESGSTTTFQWHSFLERWRSDLLQSSLAEKLSAELRSRYSFAGASETEISDAEARLSIVLPPSYRAFLRVTNGWGPTSQSIDSIWRVQETDWFAELNRDWVAAYSIDDTSAGMPDNEYYSYGEQAACAFKPGHLRYCLQITPVGDAAVYLINPQAITPDGEWEAWFLANWLPGVRRYRSFQELMIAQYHSFAGTSWQQPEGIVAGLPQQFSGAPGSKGRSQKKTKPSRERTTEQLIAAIGRPDLALKLFPTRSEAGFTSPEDKAVRRVYRELGKRKEERVAAALRERLPVEDGWEMREEIIDALGELKDDAATEILFQCLRKPQSVNEPICAMNALKGLAPQRLSEVLLDMLQNGSRLHFHGICMVLGELRESRALLFLKSAAGDGDADASRALTNFGADGCTALLELCNSLDPDVRGAAASDLLYCHDSRVEQALRRLLEDPAVAVQDHARTILRCLRPSQRQRSS